ncbi:MAG: YqgE/AlgH family protein [Cyclobacteriaceae bacterium]
MDYFSSDEWVEPQRGDLLISEPYLPDPNFERTVVLLCEHDDDGTFGFVLNKPSETSLGEAVEEIDTFKAELFVGGPVQQNTLHFIHKSSHNYHSGKEIVKNIYWGGEFSELVSLVNTQQANPDDFRFFAGYSGWSPGQLEEELKVKSWIIYKGTDAQLLFNTNPDLLWKEVLKRMGGKFKVMSNYPIDPRLN